MADLFASEAKENADQNRPLADRLRPQSIKDVVGQGHVIEPLAKTLSGGFIPSIIFWGPPGCGKTTLARILADHTDQHFEQISAIFSGVADLRKVFEAAKIRKANGQSTLLFVDEIHRFNKSQQDAFLPVMEDGTITLIGATTENPSFELNAALLSRAQVMVLKRLDDDALETLLQKAEKQAPLPLTPEARTLLKTLADGDGRYLLSMVEQIAAQTDTLNEEQLLQLIHRRAPVYDKGDEAHYNLLSAFHKSLRASDADAALYWMARMLTGGEDPDTIFRRMTCVASEDISNADPHALPLTIAAWQAYERLGLPEGELALAQACTYLACAPKSNASYMAIKAAKTAAKQHGSLMPPKHAMNAPTNMMKDEGYGMGYIYDHDTEEGFSGLSYFPDTLPRKSFYQPAQRGFEREINKRLEYWERLRHR
ncbi:MAG: replication-associated recombination protein A [Alphaproteobacteria bacterium]